MACTVVNVTGTSTVVAAPGAGKRLRVEAMHLSSAGANTGVRLKDEAGTYLTGQLNSLGVAGGQVTLPPMDGQYELLCGINQGLVIEYGSGSANIGGFVTTSVI